MFVEKRQQEEYGQGGLLSSNDCSGAFKLTAGLFALCLLAVGVFTIIRLMQLEHKYNEFNALNDAGYNIPNGSDTLEHALH